MSWGPWVTGHIGLQSRKHSRPRQSPVGPIAGREWFRLGAAPACVSLAFPPKRLGSAGQAGGAFLLRSDGERVGLEGGNDPMEGVAARTIRPAMASNEASS